jgi:hypothetical protein
MVITKKNKQNLSRYTKDDEKGIDTYWCKIKIHK